MIDYCARCPDKTPTNVFTHGSEKLCWSCKDAALQDAINAVPKTQLNEITQPGDFFNYQCKANVVVRNEISANPDIAEADKNKTYFDYLADFISVMDREIRQANEAIDVAMQKRSAAFNELRTYGNEVRDEIREKIKQNDVNYVPVITQVKPKVSARPKKNDPFENMAQMIAMTHGISIEAARQRLKAGGVKNEAKGPLS